MRGLLVRATAVVVVAATGYLAVTFAQVATGGAARARPSGDAIVVLGAAHYQGRPSPVFAGRLDHAANLYEAGVSPVVVVTGGRQPGDVVAEANAADAYLQRRGVPAAALRLEVDGRTSYESLAASARFLRAEGIEDVVLVSDSWHLARSAAIARDVGLDPTVSAPPTSPYSTAGALQQMVRETFALAVGRLIGYRRLDRVSVALGRL